MKLAKAEAIYRPNLLINGDFQVNQRNLGTYNNTGSSWARLYTLDRWCILGLGGAVSLTINGDGTITITNTGDEECYFAQMFENALESNDYTMSAYIVSFTGTVKMYPEGGMETALTVSNGVNVITRNGAPSGVSFRLEGHSSVTLKWVKLEHGSIATPLVPRLYAEELLLCQRYGYNVLNGSSTYGYVGDGIRIPGNLGRIWIDIPIAMRTIPTLEANGTFQLFNGTSTEVNITSFYLTNLFCSSNKISINIPNLSSYEEGDYLTMRVSNNASASFFLDAEIK